MLRQNQLTEQTVDNLSDCQTICPVCNIRNFLYYDFINCDMIDTVTICSILKQSMEIIPSL